MGLLATLTGLRLLRSIFRLVALVVTVAVVYLAVTAVQVYITGRRYDPHKAGAIVVMGAAQYNGVPSPDLRARLDEAKLLWQSHEATLIMVTGSKQPGDHFTESQASAGYLVHEGVPAVDILQAGGRDSWENLAQASPILLAHGAKDVLIVTDPFHEARSMGIASSVGLVPSPTPTHTSPIRGWSTLPYYAKETLGVGLGRIVGYSRLDALHRLVGWADHIG